MSVLKVENLSLKKGGHHILKEMSFTLEANKILGIVGQSGSGKSMLSKSLLGLHPSAHFNMEGQIRLGGQLISPKEFPKIRGCEIGLIHQNPMTAFNPVVKLKKQIADVYQSHFKVSRRQAYEDIKNFIKGFGFEDVDRVMEAYPHELSGGMLQRLSIATLLLIKPKVLIADEITTALDPNTKKEIVSLLLKIQKEYKMSILFVSHEVDILKEISHDLLVIDKGEIVDRGSVAYVTSESTHPVSRLLFGQGLSEEVAYVETRKDKQIV